jgi:membrane protein implicated in regulation of membrane protease activity
MKMPRLLAGWFLLMCIYYLAGVTLQVSLFNIAVPNLGASYLVYFSNVRLEFILVTVITSLILLALPERYRRPRWYESKPATPPTETNA